MIAPPTLRTALTTWLDLARSRKGFRFDNSRGEFIYNANGRTVPLSKLEKEGKGYRDFTNENMQYQTERMLDGRISLPEWQRRMVREIRDSWRTEYILGRGGIDQMTQADWGRIGGRLQFQYRQLDRFADRILLGDMTPAQIRANAKLYANASVTGLYDGRTTAKVQAGYIGESRHLRPGESCNSCIGYEAQGIVIIGTLPEPGQQSECYTNCNCYKKYYRELPGQEAPAPKPIDETPFRFKDSLTPEEKGIINQSYESAIAYDDLGNIILQKDGENHRVGFTLGDLKRLNGASVTHNHPGGLSFSPDDWYLASRGKMKTLRAVGISPVDGIERIYQIDILDDSFYAMADDLRESILKAANELVDAITPDSIAYSEDYNFANAFYAHNLSRAIEQLVNETGEVVRYTVTKLT